MADDKRNNILDYLTENGIDPKKLGKFPRNILDLSDIDNIERREIDPLDSFREALYYTKLQFQNIADKTEDDRRFAPNVERVGDKGAIMVTLTSWSTEPVEDQPRIRTIKGSNTEILLNDKVRVRVGVFNDVALNTKLAEMISDYVTE